MPTRMQCAGITNKVLVESFEDHPQTLCMGTVQGFVVLSVQTYDDFVILKLRRPNLASAGICNSIQEIAAQQQEDPPGD